MSQVSARPSDDVTSKGKFSMNEDWLATIVGLVLLVLCLAGIITPGMVSWK